jgi:hypothetical protein
VKVGNFFHAWKGTSDRDGRYSISAPAGEYEVTAWHKREVGRSEHGSFGSGQVATGVDVQLQPSAKLTVRVRERATGRPIPGVSVYALPDTYHPNRRDRFERDETDRGGVLELSSLLPGEIYVRVGWKPYGIQTQELVLAPGEARAIEFRVVRTGEIEGTVTDGHGRPVAGALVRLTSLETNEPTRRSGAHGPCAMDAIGAPTKWDGRFSIDELIGRFKVTVEKYGASTATEVLVQEGRATAVQLRLDAPEAGTVLVDLLSSVRTAPEAIVVQALPEGQTSGSLWSFERRPDGAFMSELPPGRYNITARPSEQSVWDPYAKAFVEVRPGVTTKVQLKLAVASTRGIVRDRDGHPLAEVKISMDGNCHDRTTSRADGRFELLMKDSERGHHGVLRAQREGMTATLNDVVVGAQDLDVKLSDAAELAGRVEGAPSSFVLYLFSQGAAYALWEPRSFLGSTFEIKNLPAGPVEVLVRTADGKTGRTLVKLAAGVRTTAVLSLGGLARVVGRLITHRNGPWVGPLGSCAFGARKGLQRILGQTRSLRGDWPDSR